MTMDHNVNIMLGVEGSGLDSMDADIARIGTTAETKVRSALVRLTQQFNMMAMAGERAGQRVARAFTVLPDSNVVGRMQSKFSGEIEKMGKASTKLADNEEKAIARIKGAQEAHAKAVEDAARRIKTAQSAIDAQNTKGRPVTVKQQSDLQSAMAARDKTANPPDFAAQIAGVRESFGKKLVENANAVEQAMSKLAGAGAPVQRMFDQLSKEQIASLPITERNRFELLNLGAAIEKMARSGSVSAGGLQSLNTRLAQLVPTTQQERNMVKLLSDELQRMQLVMQDAATSIRLAGNAANGGSKLTKNMADNLQNVQAAAAGMMLGMAALQGSVTGVGFSLIFARFSELGMMAASAALTIVIAGTAKAMLAFGKALKSTIADGRAFEDMGQRMASFFGSGEMANGLLQQAQRLSDMFSTPIKDARRMVDELRKVGMAGDIVYEATLNAAAATGKSVTEVTDRLTALAKGSGTDQTEQIKTFARDFNIANRQYRNSTELAIALNERFKNAARDAGDTLTGAFNRLGNAITLLRENVGVLMGQYLKPMIELAAGFIKAMTSGFQAARNAAMATGEHQRQMDAYRATMARLAPIVISLAFLLGRVLYNAIMLLVRITKSIIDGFLRIWAATKPLRDAIRDLVQWFKDWLGRLLDFYDKHEKLINSILAGVAAFLLMGHAVNGVLTAMELLGKGAVGLGKAILDIPAAAIRFAAQGWEDVMNKLGLLRKKLDEGWDDVNVNMSASGDADGGPSADKFALSFRERLMTAIPNAIGAALGAAAASNPVTGAIVLLGAAIVAGLYTIITEPKTAGEWGGALNGALARAVTVGATGILNLFTNVILEPLNKLVRGEFGSLGDILGNIISIDWRHAFSIGLGLLELDLGTWVGLIRGLFERDFIGSIREFFEGLFPSIKPWLEQFERGTIEGFRRAFGEETMENFRNARSEFEGALGNWDAYTGLIGGIHGRIDEMSNWLKANNPFDGIMTWLGDLITKAGEAVQALRDVAPSMPSMPSFGDMGNFFRRLPGMAIGGHVPGPPGTRQLVMAEAGERFMGAPGMERARPSGWLGGNGGGNLTVNVDLSGSVVSSAAAARELADMVSAELANRLSGARRLSLHRVG